MGLKERFGLAKRDSSSPEKMAFAHGIAVSDMNKSQGELEEAMQLGINRHLMNDDRVLQVTDALAFTPAVEADPVSGKPMIVRHIDKRWAAILVAMSPLKRVSVLEPLDADIGALEDECLFAKIKMSLSEEESENGGSDLVDAYRTLNGTAWQDAKKGNKAYLLKVNPKSYEVSFRDSNNQKK